MTDNNAEAIKDDEVIPNDEGGGAQALSQGDIDSIIGDEADLKEAKGVELLLHKALQSYIRLPMLEVIYDRFIRLNSTSLRNYTSDTVDIDIIGMTSKRFGDYMSTVPIPAMIPVFKIAELDNYGLVVIDSPLIYALMDILFGGRKMNTNLQVDGRPFTSIETNIVRNIAELILRDLKYSFDPVVPLTFQLDRIDNNARFAMVARPEDVAIILELLVTMEDRSGKIYVVLPYTTIDPIKNLLSQAYIGERGNKDPTWMAHMEKEISVTNVEVEVVLNSIMSDIEEVANLNVGKTIVLDKPADTSWEVVINKKKVGSCMPGKAKENIAVKLLSEGIKIQKV